MKTVLLTGASGFIGNYLLRQLIADGYHVVGMSNRTKDSALVACDLRDQQHVLRLIKDVNPAIIIHAAALSSPTRGETLEYYETNVVCSENVFNAVRSLSGRRRVLFLSTAGVYGNQVVDCLSEDLCPKPISHYGLSKFACEQLLHSLAQTHDITILRPFNVIGHGQEGSFLVPKLVRNFAKKSATIALGNIQPKRDFIDVEMCCKMISALIMQPESHGEVVNICSGIATSVADLLEILYALTGHAIKVIPEPSLVRSNEIWLLVGSVKKLQRLLPFSIDNAAIGLALERMLMAEQDQSV